MSSQIGGRVDISNIAAFYHEKAPMFTLSQLTTGYCNQHTPPSTSCMHVGILCMHVGIDCSIDMLEYCAC